MHNNTPSPGILIVM